MAKRRSGWTVSFRLSFSLTGSVDDIIDHYKKEQIVEGYNLKEPVSVQVGARLCPHRFFFFVRVVCDSQIYSFICTFYAFCSIRNKFSPTRSTAEKSTTLSGGNQKTLSTKTLSRKATSSSTKVRSVARVAVGCQTGRDQY